MTILSCLLQPLTCQPIAREKRWMSLSAGSRRRRRARAGDIAIDPRRTVRELERERDEARDAASASKDVYEEFEEAYRNECAAHRRMRRLALVLGMVTVVLFACESSAFWLRGVC